jgi:hypothetical protein
MFTSPSFNSSAICAATAKKLSSSEVSINVTGIFAADANHRTLFTVISDVDGISAVAYQQKPPSVLLRW